MRIVGASVLKIDPSLPSASKPNRADIKAGDPLFVLDDAGAEGASDQMSLLIDILNRVGC